LVVTYFIGGTSFFASLKEFTQESLHYHPDKEYRRQTRQVWADTLARSSGTMSFRITCKDGTTKQVELRTVVLPDSREVSIFLDVTRREQAETAMRESETKLRTIFEHSADAIFLLDDDRFIDCNDVAISMLRARNKGEILRQSPMSFLPERQPDGTPSSVKCHEMIDLALREGVSSFEWVYRRFDGSLFPVEVVLTVIPLQGKHILCAFWRDISKRKEAERELAKAREELEQRVQERTQELVEINLQLSREIERRNKIERELQESRENLRKLSEHLQTAREEERTRIAQEIHDELGMGLSAAKMDILWIAGRMSQEFQDLIGKANVVQRIDEALENVRRICSYLRPTILDHFGLGAAIEWQVGEFQKRTDIACACEVDSRAAGLQGDLASALFRILQEALTNILRHSNATSARIGLRKRAGRISLTVTDNGRGLKLEDLGRPNSFGLMGMEERARFWGGTMAIKGSPGKGTQLTVTIPEARRIG
jgi:PAS domain S-box-containing protein